MSAVEVKRTGYSKIYKAAVTSDFQAMVHEELQRQRKRVAALEQLLEWARDPEMAQFFVANAVALDGGCKTAVGSDLEPTEEVEKPPEASSGTPSGGEQAPNPGSGEATDCVLCGHWRSAHMGEATDLSFCRFPGCLCEGYVSR